MRQAQNPVQDRNRTSDERVAQIAPFAGPAGCALVIMFLVVDAESTTRSTDPRLGGLLQLRNRLDRRRRRPRLEERMDFRQVGIGNHLRGVRRHLSGRPPNVPRERRERQRTRSQPRTGRARSLSLVSVALIAAVAGVQLPAFVDVRGRCRRRLRHRARRRRQASAQQARDESAQTCQIDPPTVSPRPGLHYDRHELARCSRFRRFRRTTWREALAFSWPISYRGWVTTSISDGSPRLTTSIARLIAGPRSLGLVIGPCAWTPMPCTIFA